MSIKLAIRISDGGMACHVGGGADEWSHVIEIENEELEKILQPFLTKKHQYSACSITIVREKEKE